MHYQYYRHLGILCTSARPDSELLLPHTFLFAAAFAHLHFPFRKSSASQCFRPCDKSPAWYLFQMAPERMNEVELILRSTKYHYNSNMQAGVVWRTFISAMASNLLRQTFGPLPNVKTFTFSLLPLVLSASARVWTPPHQVPQCAHRRSCRHAQRHSLLARVRLTLHVRLSRQADWIVEWSLPWLPVISTWEPVQDSITREPTTLLISIGTGFIRHASRTTASR